MSRCERRGGWVHVVTGPMFSGKTGVGIDFLQEASGIRDVWAFRPALDARSGRDQLTSHDGRSFPATEVLSVEDLWARTLGLRRALLVVDEVQFFSMDLLRVVEVLRESGHHVVLCGLDRTWDGAPFGAVPALCDFADEVTWRQPWCSVCGRPAQRSWRAPEAGTATVVVGGKDLYTPRCLSCWKAGMRETGRLTVEV